MAHPTHCSLSFSLKRNQEYAFGGTSNGVNILLNKIRAAALIMSADYCLPFSHPDQKIGAAPQTQLFFT